jgi:DNA polymerase-3 subunit alpha
LKASQELGFTLKTIDFPQELIGKHYFWSKMQIKVSSMGYVDYKRIYTNAEISKSIKGRAAYLTLEEVGDSDNDGRKTAVCATIADFVEKKFVSKKTGNTEVFAVLTLQQNNDLCECTIWPEEYAKFYNELQGCKDKLIIFSGVTKFSDFAKKNTLQFTRATQLLII